MLGYDGDWCALDVENSKFPEGVPWINGFYLSVVSITTKHTKRSWLLTHNENINNIRYLVYDDALVEIQRELSKYSVVIGHNLKHDINVLKYYGINFNNHKLFCTMVAEYLIRGHEQGRELNELALRYGLKVKDDRIKKMWDAGMNTAETDCLCCDLRQFPITLDNVFSFNYYLSNLARCHIATILINYPNLTDNYWLTYRIQYLPFILGFCKSIDILGQASCQTYLDLAINLKEYVTESLNSFL